MTKANGEPGKPHARVAPGMVRLTLWVSDPLKRRLAAAALRNGHPLRTEAQKHLGRGLYLDEPGGAMAAAATPADPPRAAPSAPAPQLTKLTKLLQSPLRDGMVPLAVWMPAALVARLNAAAARHGRSIRQEARHRLRLSIDLEAGRAAAPATPAGRARG